MKRLHIHLSVTSLAPSITFYSKLFGAEPVVTKDDYAKWMLEDPRVNFAISTRAKTGGLEHFGIQVDSDAELEDLRTHLNRENIALQNEGETVCCYMQSDKSWTRDPDSFPWEIYHSMKEARYFNSDSRSEVESSDCKVVTDKPKSGGCC